MPGKGTNLNNKPNIKAKKKFVIGPASDTVKLSNFGFEKFRELTITGLPQPKPASKRKIVPSKSKWEIGLRLSLPISFEVGSPRRLAAYAWANSCNVRANKIAKM